MTEQEKDKAWWAEPVRIRLTEWQWHALSLAARQFLIMLLSLLLSKPLKIPIKAFLVKLVWKGKEEFVWGDIAGEALCSLLEQAPEAAGPATKEEVKKLLAEMPPEPVAGEIISVEMLRQEVAALLMACSAIGLLMQEKPDWTSDELYGLAEGWLPKERGQQENLAASLTNTLDKIPWPLASMPTGEWIH